MLKPLAAMLLVSLFAGCSGSSDYYEDAAPGVKRKRASRSLSGQFEWAVQYYEAGSYQEAVKRLEALKKEGARVPEFHLIEFYLGMCHYRLGELPKAVAELKEFLRSGNQAAPSQEARITLLLAYEKLGLWKESASLSAETHKLTLFHYNRGLLHLLWARALTEQGEILGAKAALDESMAFLDKMGEGEPASTFFSHPDQDLWGRFHFTQVLLETKECGLTEPKEVLKKKRLYEPWMDSVTDCLRSAISHASKELFAKESQWGETAENALVQAIESFANKIRGHLKREASVIERHRALNKTTRESYYRLLGTVDEHLKSFKNQGLNALALERMRKQIDRLLVGVSGPL